MLSNNEQIITRTRANCEYLLYTIELEHNTLRTANMNKSYLTRQCSWLRSNSGSNIIAREQRMRIEFEHCSDFEHIHCSKKQLTRKRVFNKRTLFIAIPALSFVCYVVYRSICYLYNKKINIEIKEKALTYGLDSLEVKKLQKKWAYLLTIIVKIFFRQSIVRINTFCLN